VTDPQPTTGELPVTARTQVRRLPERQRTDRELLHAIVDEALIAHVAVVRDGLPVVIPFAVARDGDDLLLHGSTGAGLLRAAGSAAPISVAITHVDALVVARSSFDNSMNYRSVVAFGTPQVVEGEAKTEALKILTDHLLPGRWDEVRASTRRELAATLVLRLPLDEVSVKVRDAPATVTEDDGEDRRVWAGLLPLRMVTADPITHPEVPAGVEVPASVRAAGSR
jgi:nitroimidazol reductase NimA-like FMN-containing flavoprotein (pyridoxamine 5'-phosphate oxidase superfamily)